MIFKKNKAELTIILVGGLLSPLPATAQSILQTADDFVVLGGSAVSVAGAGPNTYSNGDVGSAGLISGFPPATVVNGSLIGPGAIVNQALIDLGNARNGLSALASTSNLTGQDLSGMTLTPGVYAFNVAAEISLAGTKILTLDANFQNNVVWVFNIGTSLTTAAGAQIQFTNLGSNGGSDNGLFWNAGTSITFGEGNIVAGNYLAGTNITFGTTVPSDGSGSGRALALAIVSFAGEATLDALGGPGGGDLAGGLTFDNGVVSSSGYVLLSDDGAYTQGSSNVVLIPGTPYNTTGVVIDGDSRDAVIGVSASLTVFQTSATLTGVNNIYTGGTFIDAGQLITGSVNLPTDGNVTFIDSNNSGVLGELVFDQPSDGSFGGLIAGDGSVVKNGIGALTFTAANSYTGGTLVNAGTLALSGAGTLGDTTGALAVDGGTLDLGTTSQTVGAVTLNGGTISNGTLTGTSYTSTGGTIDANLSGAGIVFINTSGTTTLTGENTYTGGTQVNGGTLIGNTTSLPLDQNVTLANGGALVFDQAADGSFGGLVSGNGSLTKQGAGALTVVQAQTYTGGTTIDAGSLIASTSLMPVDGDIALGNDGTLVLNQTANGILGGNVTGGGTIEKQGSASLMIANDTTAAIDLLAGALYLINDVGSTTVASGAFLRGEGGVNGDLFNGGTVSPGFSPGVIVVAGNYTQTSAGTLVVEIASPSSFDQLLVGGTASLDGTLELDLLNGFAPVGNSFTIITSGGGVSGEFATITGTPGTAAVQRSVNYGTNDVTVTYTQLPFSGFADTPNEASVGDAVQNSPTITAILNTLPLASQFPAALNAISPQGYQVWSDIAFAHATSLTDRLARQPTAVPGHDDFYFEAGQSRGRISGDRDVASVRYTSDSGLVGGNHAISEHLTLGGFFEYTESDSGLGSAGSSTEMESKMFGLRAAWKQGSWFANAVVAYGFDDYESKRTINFPGVSTTAKSETNGKQWIADISGGRRFQTGPVSLSPFAGLQVAAWKAAGFTETGAGVFNATLDRQSARSLQSQAGLEAAVDFALGSALVRPHVRAAWLHEFSNDSRSIDGTLDGGEFNIETREPDRDSARLSAGFDVAFSPRVSLYADYAIQTGDTVRVVGEWRAGLSIGF